MERNWTGNIFVTNKSIWAKVIPCTGSPFRQNKIWKLNELNSRNRKKVCVPKWGLKKPSNTPSKKISKGPHGYLPTHCGFSNNKYGKGGRGKLKVFFYFSLPLNLTLIWTHYSLDPIGMKSNKGIITTITTSTRLDNTMNIFIDVLYNFSFTFFNSGSFDDLKMTQLTDMFYTAPV